MGVNNIGTLVTSPIRPASSSDTYPTAYALEILGGFKQVQTSAERDAIPKERRIEGMFCYVIQDGIIYKLKGGIDNANWSVFSSDSITINLKFQPFVPNYSYSYNETIIQNGVLYSAKVSFISGDTFNPSDWTVVGGDMKKSVYDKDNDGIVDKAQYSSIAGIALETSLIQEWKPNTVYITGQQLVYLSKVYTVTKDFTTPATFDTINLELTATGHHSELLDLQGGDSGKKEYYHLSQEKYNIINNFSVNQSNIQFNSKTLGDMSKSDYDKDNDGIVDLALNLLGLNASVSELNFVKGTKSNIQAQLDAVTHGMVFQGVVATYADIDITYPNPSQGDTVIVTTDETKDNARTFYTKGGSSWIYLGQFSVSVRDFSTNPLDINNESTGILAESRIDSAIARKVDVQTLPNFNLVSTYTQTDADIINAVSSKHNHANKIILDSYNQTNVDLTDAVNKKHTHQNANVLTNFSEDTEGNVLYKGSLIQGAGSGGGVTDLSKFNTNDLADTTNRRYVTDADKANLANLTSVVATQGAMSNTLTDALSKIPPDASNTNKLVSTNTLNSQLLGVKFTSLADVDSSVKRDSFIVVNDKGTITYRTSIKPLIKIQQVIDKTGAVFSDVPILTFNNLEGVQGQDGSLILNQGDLFTTDLKDMPKHFVDGHMLVANANTMTYELKDPAVVMNSQANYTAPVSKTDWVMDTNLGVYTTKVVHSLDSDSLIVGAWDLDRDSIDIKYKIIDMNTIMLKSISAMDCKIVVNCSQGTIGGNGGNAIVTATDFIDDVHVRTDKTYSSQQITSKLSSYALSSSVYPKAQADALFALKVNEHAHTNMNYINKISEDAYGNMLYDGKKILTNLQPTTYQSVLTKQDHSSSLDLVVDVNDLFIKSNYNAIINSEFIIKNNIPTVDPVTDAKGQNQLHLVAIDGTMVVLDVLIPPQSTEKYILGISPNLKIMVQGIFDSTFYLTAY